MRVLTITGQIPTPEQSGTMHIVRKQIESLRGIGVQIDVQEIKGISKIKYLQALPGVWSKVVNYDLVHAHFGYSGWVARGQLRRPVVVSFMGDDLLGTPHENGRVGAMSRLVVQINRLMSHTMDAVIVKSAEMARVVAPVPAYVIPNGVDMDFFRPIKRIEACAQLGLDLTKRYVLFPGDPKLSRKNYPLARAVFERAISSLSFEVELITLGDVPYVKVPLLMNASDCMLFTSFIEGSPNVVKEGMACNLPIVSVSVGDVPELLEGVEGCFICSREVEVLAEALMIVLHTQKRCNGRDILAQKDLDHISVARKIAKVYNEVI
jgi:glycosyltransferase involved in cell wall biosynthesis